MYALPNAAAQQSLSTGQPSVLAYQPFTSVRIMKL